MTIALYTNSVSAHQLPLARELVARVGSDNFRYIYTGVTQGGGQEVSVNEPWIVLAEKKLKCEVEHRSKDESTTIPHSSFLIPHSSLTWLDSADVLLSGIRDVELFERRSAKGLKTFYQSERWFKPIEVGGGRLKVGQWRLCLPGWMRMLVPSYRKMAKRFVRWANSDPNAHVLAIGPWAKRDMLRLGVNSEKIVDWGYFVAPSARSDQRVVSSEKLRILWVGRQLWWKRVDTIRKAVAHVPNATLDVFTNISLAQVREEMRRHDIYVLASNELEGWGAALNEALEEGMTCFGTYEAGASAAMLPKENLFHAGDWKTLAKMLMDKSFVSTILPDAYTPQGAARKLFSLLNLNLDL